MRTEKDVLGTRVGGNTSVAKSGLTFSSWVTVLIVVVVVVEDGGYGRGTDNGAGLVSETTS